jgi:hypothetical protein
MTKIAASGSASGSVSVSQRHGSADPDPDPNPDTPKCYGSAILWFIVFSHIFLLCCRLDAVSPEPGKLTKLRRGLRRNLFENILHNQPPNQYMRYLQKYAAPVQCEYSL